MRGGDIKGGDIKVEGCHVKETVSGVYVWRTV